MKSIFPKLHYQLYESQFAKINEEVTDKTSYLNFLTFGIFRFSKINDPTTNEPISIHSQFLHLHIYNTPLNFARTLFNIADVIIKIVKSLFFLIKSTYTTRHTNEDLKKSIVYIKEILNSTPQIIRTAFKCIPSSYGHLLYKLSSIFIIKQQQKPTEDEKKPQEFISFNEEQQQKIHPDVKLVESENGDDYADEMSKQQFMQQQLFIPPQPIIFYSPAYRPYHLSNNNQQYYHQYITNPIQQPFFYTHTNQPPTVNYMTQQSIQPTNNPLQYYRLN